MLELDEFKWQVNGMLLYADRAGQYFAYCLRLDKSFMLVWLQLPRIGETGRDRIMDEACWTAVKQSTWTKKLNGRSLHGGCRCSIFSLHRSGETVGPHCTKVNIEEKAHRYGKRAAHTVLVYLEWGC